MQAAKVYIRKKEVKILKEGEPKKLITEWVLGMLSVRIGRNYHVEK